jgi:hypothetical protein
VTIPPGSLRRCRRSFELSLLVRVNASSRREDVLYSEFLTSRGDSEVLAMFYAQRRRTELLRAQRARVSARAIARCRHALMLANARGGDATTLDNARTSISVDSHEMTLEVALTEWEPDTPSPRPPDEFVLTESGPHAPPTLTGGPP